MKNVIEYDFAKEFSPFPGPREIKIGPNSGEEFRENVLNKFYEENQPILLDIDGTKVSFGPSFLSESFGLFAKNNKLTLEKFEEFIQVKTTSDKNKRFKEKMLEYVKREIENV